MSKIDSTTQPVIIPTLRYLDGQSAITWLCNAFGFKKQLVVIDKKLVANLQLTYGNSIILLGAAQNNAFNKLVKSPLETGCAGSQSVHIIVDEVDVPALAKANAGMPMAAGVLYTFTSCLLSPMVAALSMNFCSVSVITNALRLRSVKHKVDSNEPNQPNTSFMPVIDEPSKKPLTVKPAIKPTSANL